MRNTQNEVVASPQHPTTPFELFDTIHEKNHALRAFGALLRTADLSEFVHGNFVKGSPGESEAESIQYGLSQIVNLYLADQEQTVEAFADEYHESDEWLISSASSTIKLFEEGIWNPGHIPMDRFSEALEGLETVIARNPTLSPIAVALKASIIKHIPTAMSHNNDQGEAS